MVVVELQTQPWATDFPGRCMSTGCELSATVCLLLLSVVGKFALLLFLFSFFFFCTVWCHHSQQSQGCSTLWYAVLILRCDCANTEWWIKMQLCAISAQHVLHMVVATRQPSSLIFNVLGLPVLPLLHQPNRHKCGSNKGGTLATERCSLNSWSSIHLYWKWHQVCWTVYLWFCHVSRNKSQELPDKKVATSAARYQGLSILIKCRNPKPSGCHFANKILICICQKR